MITWWFDDEQIQPEVDRLQIVSTYMYPIYLDMYVINFESHKDT